MNLQFCLHLFPIQKNLNSVFFLYSNAPFLNVIFRIFHLLWFLAYINEQTVFFLFIQKYYRVNTVESLLNGHYWCKAKCPLYRDHYFLLKNICLVQKHCRSTHCSLFIMPAFRNVPFKAVFDSHKKRRAQKKALLSCNLIDCRKFVT